MRQVLLIFVLFALFFFKTDFKIDNFLESINRRVYSFNRGVDKILIIPSTHIYINYIPTSIDKSVNNFFLHMSEGRDLFFKLFSYDFSSFYFSGSRFLINSVFGFCGIFDLSKNANLIYQKFDFNLFFKCYDSQYMVLPILGPGTVKLSICLLLMQLFNPGIYFVENLLIYYFLEIVFNRSKLMFDSSFFHNNMIDGYSFLKDIFIQTISNFDIDNDFLLTEPSD